MDPVQRESDVANFLETIQGRADSVLIGGYAVSAYGPPRFSADVDIVLAQSEFGPVRRWLSEEGFSARISMGSEIDPDALRKLRAVRGDVSSDLYFGGVRARESGAEVPYDWLEERPRSMRLRLRTLTTRKEIRVVRPEALWVLKLIAGRSQDISDLFAIREQPISADDVTGMLASLATPSLQSTFDRVSRLLESSVLYSDSLSRWGLGSPDLPRNRAEWRAFKERAATFLSPKK